MTGVRRTLAKNSSGPSRWRLTNFGHTFGQEKNATEINMPLDAAPLESTRDATRRLGTQPAFGFSVDSTLAFSGRLCARGVMLHSNRKFTEGETAELRDCLFSLGLELETYCG